MKKPSLSSLIKKADTATSLYIRQKFADHAGYVSCITCGKPMHWKDSECAHYIERAKFGTRFVEENLAPACTSCNHFRKEFHKREYTLYVIDTYGREKIDELKQLANKSLSPSQKRQIIEEALEYYTGKLKEL